MDFNFMFFIYMVVFQCHSQGLVSYGEEVCGPK